MRISFFVPKCTPDNSHGRYVVELSKRIGREHEVTVHSGAFWPPLRSVVRCRFTPVPVRPALIRLASLWTSSILSIERRSSDIVHIQGADAPVGNIVTAHCCNSAMKVAAGQSASVHRRVNYAVGVAVEKYCMSKQSTRRIIAVSGKVRREILDAYQIDSERVVVVHHGVDLDAFHPEHKGRWRALVRQRLGLSLEDFVVLFVGGEYRLKGLVTLLDAAKRLTGRLKVVAVGVKADAALIRTVKDHNLSALVTFVEYTAEVASYYAAADCFVLPTLYDTFSMATLEAMASGLPVIISSAAGVVELLSPGRDCFIIDDPRDSATITGRLEQLIGDVKLRNDIGAEARKTAEHHSWDDVAHRTLAVYGETLADRG